MCPVHQQVNFNGSAMFAFEFDAHLNSEPTNLVTHGCELDYLFNPLATNDPALSLQMQKWWTNFAIYHDPNGVDAPTAAAPTWPSADLANL